MNFQLGDTQQVKFGISGKDANGEPAVPQPGDLYATSSSNSSAATAVMDATPDTTTFPGAIATGTIIAGTLEATGVVITISLTHVGQPPIIITDTIDIVGGPATTLGISLGTPTSQTPAAAPAGGGGPA